MESFQVHTFYRPFTLLEWINCKEKHSQLKSLGLCNFVWINISCQKKRTDTFSFTAYKGGEIIISISLSMQLQYWFSCFLPKYCSNLLWSNISSEKKMDYINQQVFPVWDLHWKYWLTQKLWSEEHFVWRELRAAWHRTPLCFHLSLKDIPLLINFLCAWVQNIANKFGNTQKVWTLPQTLWSSEEEYHIYIHNTNFPLKLML